MKPIRALELPIKEGRGRGVDSAKALSSRRLNTPWLPTAVFLTFGLLTIVQWEPAPIDFLAPLLALCAGLNLVNFQGRRFLLDRRFVFAVYALSVVSVITVQRTVNPFQSFRYWAITSLVILIGVCAHLIGQRAELIRPALTGMILISAVTMLTAILGFLGFLPIQSVVSAGGDIRLEGFSKNPNAMGALSTVLILVTADSLMNHKYGRLTSVPRWYSCVAIVIFISAGFLSFSRSAWGATFLALAIFVILMGVGRVKLANLGSLVVPILFVTVAGLLAYRFAPPSSLAYIEGKFEQDLADNPRFQYQQEALTRVWEHPIIGHGPLGGAMEMGLGAHNAYITQLHDYGIVGFVLMCFVLIPPVVFSIKVALGTRDKYLKRIAAIYSGVLISQYAIGFLMDFIHQRHVWIFIGFGWALPVLVRSIEKRAHSNDSPIEGEIGGNGTSVDIFPSSSTVLKRTVVSS